MFLHDHLFNVCLFHDSACSMRACTIFILLTAVPSVTRIADTNRHVVKISTKNEIGKTTCEVFRNIELIYVI